MWLASAGALVVLGVIAAVIAIRALRKSSQAGADVLTWVAASIATAVSAQGMWQFTARTLDVHWSLRALGFAFIEVAVVTSAVRARRNMREQYTAGPDGVAVWALTALSAVLSSLEARSAPEALFRLAAPLVAAWLWERGMAIERRRTLGKGRIHWRVTPERILVRLGLAEASDRTAGEVDTQRRLTRVALAAKRVRDLTGAGARPRRLAAARRGLERAYTAAAAHTPLARDKAVQMALGVETAALYDAEALVSLTPASAWSPAAKPDGFDRLADETRHLNEMLALRGDLARIAEDARNAVANAAMIGSLVSGEHLRPVARHDHSRDRAETGLETGLAVTIPAPRRRTTINPGSPWPVGHLAPLDLTAWHASRPHRGLIVPPPLVPAPVPEPDSDGDDPETAPETGQVPDGDRKTPSDEDNRRARRSIITTVKRWKKPLPAPGDLAAMFGYSRTWARNRIQEVRQQLVDEGWTFDENGMPVPPDGEVTAVNGSHGGDS
jgi:hypothetical protein